MFIITKPDASQVVSQNRPTDDIMGGLLAYYGEGIRVVRLTTDADFESARALPNLRLEAEGTTIRAYSRETVSESPLQLGPETLAATFEGVLVYPT